MKRGDRPVCVQVLMRLERILSVASAYVVDSEWKARDWDSNKRITREDSR